MNKLLNKISDKLLPFAQILASNRYLAAIRDAFMCIMPIIIGCSIFTLLNSVFLGKGNYFDKWFHMPLTPVVNLGNAIGSAGMSLMTILLVFLISKNLAKYYQIDEDSTAITAIVSFLIITTFKVDDKLGEILQTYYLGAAGLFTGFLVAILTVEVLRFFYKFKKIQITMPEGVPTGIARSFNVMIPVILTMIVFGLIRLITDAIGLPLNDFIFKSLQTPLSKIVTSPIGLVVIYIFYMLLWGFGIHSAYIIGSPILEPIYLANLTVNIGLITKHQVGVEVLTKPFTDSMMFMGGAANMMALILAIFIVSKRKDYRQIAILGFLPACFNISEPIMFGLPVVMNPILIIPMILVTLVGLGIGYLATIIGFMPYTYVMTPWITPPLLGAFLSTGGSITALLTALLVLVLSTIIYMPFVKVMDKEVGDQSE